MTQPTTSLVPRLAAEVRAALEEYQRHAPRVDAIIRCVTDTLQRGNKVLTAGNGGSAAQALHLSEELIGRYSRQRRPLAAICLSSDVTAMSCIANDFGFEEVFARQVEALGRPGDVLIVLSTSGASKNIVKALERARGIKLATIGLLGPPGSAAEKLCDLALTLERIPPARVQEMHLLTIHGILDHADAVFG